MTFEPFPNFVGNIQKVFARKSRDNRSLDMTVIAGILDSGKVWIGGDSAATSGFYDVRLYDRFKVFRNGDFLIGCAGGPRPAQIARYSFVPPKPKEGQLQSDNDLNRYMVVDFVDALRTALKAGGASEEDKKEESVNTTFLVGYRGRLFEVCHDYQVAMHLACYAATGSGKSYAMGSFYSTPGMPPENRLRLALQAAAEFSAAVRPPFDIDVI